MNVGLSVRQAVVGVLLFGVVSAAKADKHSSLLQAPPNTNETVILIRHGEKPSPKSVGQLDCQGLNRALALPTVLARFGKPKAIFAPDPAVQNDEGDPMPFAPRYSYIRPLATIEPYAIALDMPVNTQIGYKSIDELEHEILKPEYANGLVVISWEHIQAWKLTEHLLATFGLNPALAPPWKTSDYDSIYVFHFFAGQDGKRHLKFEIQQEKLNNMPTTCPAAPKPVG